MFAWQAISTRTVKISRGISRAATHQRFQAWVVSLGLLAVTAAVTGQDRSRFAESPRTALRASQATAPQATASQTSRAIDPRQRDGGSNPPPAGYAEHFVTEMQDQYKTVYVPIIEHQTEPTRAWWNPLGLSVGTFQPRPVVRWETRVEKIRVPVRYRELVAETPAASQPTSSSTASNRPQAATGNGDRTAARAVRVTPNPGPAPGLPEPQFGGISRLDSDKPRFGTRPGSQTPNVVR